MPASFRFDVFGKIMLAESSDEGWRLFVLGADGKRCRADIVVPAFVQERELEQYLDDMFHEWRHANTPVSPAFRHRYGPQQFRHEQAAYPRSSRLAVTGAARRSA